MLLKFQNWLKNVYLFLILVGSEYLPNHYVAPIVHLFGSRLIIFENLTVSGDLVTRTLLANAHIGLGNSLHQIVYRQV